MTRLIAIALALVAATAPSFANGRPPGTSTITFRAGADKDVVAGTTFGLVISHDSGATWGWMCEDALHYAGIYDPVFAYTTTGALFATTITSPEVTRDGCTFDPTPLADKVVASDALAPDGTLFMAAGDTNDAKIYRSSDDGATFPFSAAPAPNGTWWNSVAVAPSDAMRVYATGYHFSGTRMFDLFRSTDGGTSYVAMQATGLTTTANSEVQIVGISSTDPGHIYAHVSFQVINMPSEAIFKSTDGGDTWTKIRDEVAPISFLLRGNGDLIVATRNGAVISKSPSDGASWQPIAGAPHINCLAENTAGEVWACTDNYGGDGAGIMKTTDLATWTPVLKFENIRGPVECAAGTLQHDVCVNGTPLPTPWCTLRTQLGIIADPTACPAAGDVTMSPPKHGCCDTGSDAPSALGLIALVALALLHRPRSQR